MRQEENGRKVSDIYSICIGHLQRLGIEEVVVWLPDLRIS
jgi:hypothetical protein